MSVILKESGKLFPRYVEDGIEYVKLPWANGKYEAFIPLSELKKIFDSDREEFLKWSQRHSKKQEQEALNTGKIDSRFLFLFFVRNSQNQQDPDAGKRDSYSS